VRAKRGNEEAGARVLWRQTGIEAGIMIAKVREGGMKRERRTRPEVLKKRRAKVAGT
jgi:hypothetical protein